MQNRCSLGDDTTYQKCSDDNNKCKQVNNYMLGYKYVAPPSSTPKMC